LDVPQPMRYEKISKEAGLDWKATGYLVSIVSVLFLGAVASDKPHAPWWYYPALIVGMATSILGMAFRYMAHLHQKREMKRTEAEARSPRH
jgi:uncharacterized transporter YbjL